MILLIKAKTLNLESIQPPVDENASQTQNKNISELN